MIYKYLLLSLSASQVFGFDSPSFKRGQLPRFSTNADVFGAPKTEEVVDSASSSMKYSVKSTNYKDEAQRLREEAQQLEIALRDEARAKGLPEEMINKLVPVGGKSVVKPDDSKSKQIINKLPAKDLRSRLGYLNTGDAVRMVSELDRLKSKDLLTLWNSKDFTGVSSFASNNMQVKSRTGFDITNLRLDDAGFEYQKVFGIAVLFATVFAVGSNFIGGPVGFIFGYLSAILPILLVGVGSIAPGLIADILNQYKYATNPEEKQKNIQKNAGKFLVGYLLGLPIAQFKVSSSSPSNEVTFFQLRPTGKSEGEDRKMFAMRRFSQGDIARASVTLLAGSVAECMAFGTASGSSGRDISVLYDLLTAVDPPLTPDASQNFVRWAVITAYDILKQNQPELERLKRAFAEGLPLEECIAMLEGSTAAVVPVETKPESN